MNWPLVVTNVFETLRFLFMRDLCRQVVGRSPCGPEWCECEDEIKPWQNDVNRALPNGCFMVFPKKRAFFPQIIHFNKVFRKTTIHFGIPPFSETSLNRFNSRKSMNNSNFFGWNCLTFGRQTARRHQFGDFYTQLCRSRKRALLGGSW